MPVLPLLSALSPARLHACAVCFGQSDNANLGRAYGWGILIMLGFTFFLLGSLALAVYRIEVLRAANEPDPPLCAP